MLDNKSILITGGTGSFGKKCVETILEKYKPRRLVIYSRDELKQYEMAQKFSPNDYPCLRYFIGDVRDLSRMERAFQGIDYVIHAAALKQVPAAEYNPTECIRTNVTGAENVINAAIECGVKKVIALSTDKAVSPVNLYGATKLCSDKLFVAANAYTGAKAAFSIVRYGNVMGSRGSVIPLYLKKLRDGGAMPVTDERMTRFWIVLKDAVQMVLNAFELAQGGEIFVPKIPSMRIVDLAKALAPDREIELIGIRPGEKIHEVMITPEDSRHTVDIGQYYVIKPETYKFEIKNSIPVEEGFKYSSDNNTQWLSGNELRNALIKEGFKIN